MRLGWQIIILLLTEISLNQTTMDFNLELKAMCPTVMETMEQTVIKGEQILEFWQMVQVTTLEQPAVDQLIEADLTTRTHQESTVLSRELLVILIILWEERKSKPKITRE